MRTGRQKAQKKPFLLTQSFIILLLKSEEYKTMANVKVAINGFGRIGRLAFRQMFDAEGYEIVAINEIGRAHV